MLVNMFVGRPSGNYDRLPDFGKAVPGSLFFAPSASFLASASGQPRLYIGEDSQRRPPSRRIRGRASLQGMAMAEQTRTLTFFCAGSGGRKVSVLQTIIYTFSDSGESDRPARLHARVSYSTSAGQAVAAIPGSHFVVEETGERLVPLFG
jgi:hypothetical protein